MRCQKLVPPEASGRVSYLGIKMSYRLGQHKEAKPSIENRLAWCLICTAALLGLSVLGFALFHSFSTSVRMIAGY